jgi:hypothetical protein
MAFRKFGGEFYGSAVIGKECTWAVSVCHHLHRSMLLRNELLPRSLESSPSPLPTLNRAGIRKSRINPVSGLLHDTAAWQVYVGNFYEDEIFTLEEFPTLLGATSARMGSADTRYIHIGCVENATGCVTRQLHVQRLGSRHDGQLGRRDLPAGFFSALLSLRYWALGAEHVSFWPGMHTVRPLNFGLSVICVGPLTSGLRLPISQIISIISFRIIY